VHPGGIKTNIAHAALIHPSVRTLELDENDDGSEFERTALTTPEKAAAITLKAV
jgi:hypothetical protein